LVRIDKLLNKKFETSSRTYFQYLIENSFVLVNGKAVKKSFIPKIDDEIEVFFKALPNTDLKPQKMDFDILFEDEHIIAINKPAGLVVHPGAGNWENTFVNGLLYHCKDLIPVKDDIRPGIVHRLDKDTSGVLLAAKTNKAHQNLIEQFKLRKVIKKYLAVAFGNVENQTIDSPIKRDKIFRKKMSVDFDGKNASTQILTIDRKDDLSLVLAMPKTGRTHQIRVHLKSINSPILGDCVYGTESVNKKYRAKRQFLHALSLELLHPIDNKPLKIEAPMAEDLKKFIEKFFEKKVFIP